MCLPLKAAGTINLVLEPGYAQVIAGNTKLAAITAPKIFFYRGGQVHRFMAFSALTPSIRRLGIYRKCL